MKWIRSLGIFTVLAAIGTAIVMVLRAKQSGRMQERIKQGEDLIVELSRGTDADIESAKKLQGEIKAKKIQAKAIRAKSEAALERLGEDQTMGDIASKFNNSGRVRRKPRKPA